MSRCSVPTVTWCTGTWEVCGTTYTASTRVNSKPCLCTSSPKVARKPQTFCARFAEGVNHRKIFVLIALFSYTCPECGIAVKHESSLSRHIKTAHASERSFACDQCNKNYKRNCDLLRHKRVSFKSEKLSSGAQLVSHLNGV